VGWNTLSSTRSPLFGEALESRFVYFVHSYYAPVNPCTVAIADYILPFSAALHKDNFYAVQFHPEKSGAAGAAILENFLRFAE
jgi:glutamine amidotransferase